MPLTCYIHKEVITVPKGFKTDFASVPRFLWAFFPPYGKYTEAAIMHDYLYDLQDRPRKVADQLFYDALLLCQVPKWKAKLMYYGVRAFGFYPKSSK